MSIEAAREFATDETLRRIATHEAGHAVIGRVLEITCWKVTIVPDEDTLGHCAMSNPL